MLHPEKGGGISVRDRLMKLEGRESVSKGVRMKKAEQKAKKNAFPT